VIVSLRENEGECQIDSLPTQPLSAFVHLNEDPGARCSSRRTCARARLLPARRWKAMSWSAPDWICTRGETNPPGDNRFESSEGLRVGVEAAYDRRSEVSLRAPGGHSCVTHSRNQADTRGHRRTRRRSNSSTGGTARTPQDTRGHAIGPVRDREAPGSNPGPPTNF
jgi:hypothetical protein